MSRRVFFTGLLMLIFGLLGTTAKTNAAIHDVTINPLSEACPFNNLGTCAYTPNPLTISSGDSVVWHNPAGGTAPHTATSDALGNTTSLTPPVAPANDWS